MAVTPTASLNGVGVGRASAAAGDSAGVQGLADVVGGGGGGDKGSGAAEDTKTTQNSIIFVSIIQNSTSQTLKSTM
jgi:hypothetical protein